MNILCHLQQKVPFLSAKSSCILSRSRFTDPFREMPEELEHISKSKVLGAGKMGHQRSQDLALLHQNICHLQKSVLGHLLQERFL